MNRRLSIHGNWMRNKCTPKLLVFSVLAVFAILFVYFEETRIGQLANLYGNFYTEIVHRPIEVSRKDLAADSRLNISVLVVVDSRQRLSTDYRLAQRTLRCYCALHQYRLELIDLSRADKSIGSKCPHKDFMFRRHCVLAVWLSANPSTQWVLFLDADMGVISPNHLLEQYLNRSADLIFYERTFNGEIMAGSYFAQNTPFARQMLHFWANYTRKVPNSFHGTDNGAIHAVYFDLFCGDAACSEKWPLCYSYWSESRSFSDLRPFSVCTRHVLGARNEFYAVPKMAERLGVGGGKVVLLTDFRHYWARDGWLTSNKWSPEDFIFHGWQSTRLDRAVWFAEWHSPLVLEGDGPAEDRCLSALGASLQWPYKDTFLRTEAQIGAEMDAVVHTRRAQDMALLNRMLAL